MNNAKTPGVKEAGQRMRLLRAIHALGLPQLNSEPMNNDSTDTQQRPRGTLAEVIIHA